MNKRFSLDRKLGWLAFPGLIRSIALLQIVFFVLLIMRPEAKDVFILNPDKVMAGEFWRLVSFVFHPLVVPDVSTNLVFSCLFAFFAMKISFIINDVLEAIWGELQTSIFVYAVIITQSASLFLGSMGNVPGSYYLTLYFAFASLQPKMVFRLFFVIPVHAWVLAALGAFGVIANCAQNPTFTPYLLGLHAAYLIWAIPTFIRWSRNRGKVRVRRAKFTMAKGASEQTLHRCSKCGKTEITDPEMDFRVTADGEEYCLDHLKKTDKGSAP